MYFHLISYIPIDFHYLLRFSGIFIDFYCDCFHTVSRGTVSSIRKQHRNARTQGLSYPYALQLAGNARPRTALLTDLHCVHQSSSIEGSVHWMQLACKGWSSTKVELPPPLASNLTAGPP